MTESRQCIKCIHSTPKGCSAWVCKMETLEDYRNKVIDEFAEKLKETLNTYIEDAKSEGDYTYIEPFEISKRAVNEVSKDLKAGGE